MTIAPGRCDPARCTPHPPQGVRAFTLAEQVMALAIASVLFLAMAGAMTMASRALPSKNDPLRSSVQASQAIDQIASEIESAVYVSQLSSHLISFTVADRDGDNLPERITYVWSGKAGDPLYRTYNGTSSTVAVDSVQSFSLVPTVRYVSETYPGTGVEDASSSVLQDCTASTNLGNQSFGSANTSNFGQYFSPTFTPDVIAFRPTGVTIRAMVNRTPGSFRVGMRQGSAAQLLPYPNVLEEQTVNSSVLTSTMTTYRYNFTTLPRLSSVEPVCLALMWDSGQGPAKIESNGAYAGLLKTGSSITNWSYSNNNNLSAQLYGVPMRMGSTRQTATTQYLLGVAIALQAGPAGGPTVQTSAYALNHPELVNGLWEAKFDKDPTMLDINGDGALDWQLQGGATFNTSDISTGSWVTSTGTLLSNPGNDFSTLTIVDLRMQSTVAGATAGFTIPACRVGSQCVPLIATLVLQADGTQTLTISQATSDSTTAQIITFGSIPAGNVDLHLIIDPVNMGVSVAINTVQRGTFPFTRVAMNSATRSATVYGSGGAVSISYVRLRLLPLGVVPS